MTASPPTVNKYDRQIRIWGDDGQSALQHASICVIGATTTATEILKNLVLPGIASFTLIDGRTVSPEDYATNFFLNTPDQTRASETMNRAEAIVNSMHALNESVRGSYIPVDPSSFLTTQAAAETFLRSFSFVIITQRSFLDCVSKTVASACATLKLPLLFARSYGQTAHVRLQLVEHCVQNSRTADAPPDLRLYAPFSELLQHILETATPKEKGEEIDQIHIPFVHILVRAVAQFRNAHDNRLPETRREKDEFSDLVRNSRPMECPADAQNYAEALRYAHLRLCHVSAVDIPAPVAKILEMAKNKQRAPTPFKGMIVSSDEIPALPQPVRLDRRSSSVKTTDCESLAKDRMDWWACAAGVAKFFDREKVLPLSGRIPDMTADTTSYVALQRLYSTQAQMDADAVYEEILNGTSDHNNAVVSRQLVKSFCKRIREIKSVHTRTIHEELNQGNKSGFADAARSEGAIDESLSGSCASPFYAALRASDIFESEFARLPGTVPSARADDIRQMHSLMAKVKESLGLSNDAVSWRDATEEMVRYAGVETHCVAAFVGGVAAQEATKVITGQFVPIEDSIVFNMANMTSVTFPA